MFPGGIQTTTELLKKLTNDGRKVTVSREGEPGAVLWVVELVGAPGALSRTEKAKMLDQALRALTVRGKAEGWLK
jgi:hypothetical protein